MPAGSLDPRAPREGRATVGLDAQRHHQVEVVGDALAEHLPRQAREVQRGAGDLVLLSCLLAAEIDVAPRKVAKGADQLAHVVGQRAVCLARILGVGLLAREADFRDFTDAVEADPCERFSLGAFSDEAVGIVHVLDRGDLDDRDVVAAQAQQPGLGADDDRWLAGRGAQRGLAAAGRAVNQQLQAVVARGLRGGGELDRHDQTCTRMAVLAGLTVTNGAIERHTSGSLARRNLQPVVSICTTVLIGCMCAGHWLQAWISASMSSQL